MPALTWDLIIPLVIKYALPAAEAIWQKAAAGKVVTQQDWDELRAMEHQSAADRLKAQLVAAGIPLTDPKALALLALVQ